MAYVSSGIELIKAIPRTNTNSGSGLYSGGLTLEHSTEV